MARVLSPEPTIDPTAHVRDCTLGIYTAVGARTSIHESTLGDYSYIVNDGSVVWSNIGKFCSIAAHCRLNPGNHPLERAALHHWTYRSISYGLGDTDDVAFFQWRKDHSVTLGHDVWVGHGVTVMPGVTIGTGAAIGAGAVVTKDVPPFAIAVGVAARILRYRFEPGICDALQRIAWWDWNRDQLAAALPDFRTLTIEAFVEKYAV